MRKTRRKDMKKAMLVGLAMVMALTLGLPGLYAQQQSTAPQTPGWYCPWMGGGQGGMMGCCMMGRGGMTKHDQGQPLSKDSAKQLLQDYLANSDNPNLKLGDIADKGTVFEASILTKDGSLVQKIQVDKDSGWFRNVS
jgi:hypothetical protein